ncbi:MAG: response regulator transcription factor [Aquincola sp.]|nr:response regulator transcription factor [Aquincola sp.]MDH4288087.1 response regulator transcription factor [Aquincola sp.]MDH5331228.1 response regulator transcription factor [Aquincola sp.]
MSIRLVLVDNNTLFRLGLAALISAHDEFQIVAHASSGREAMQSSLNCDPHVVLMDIALVDASGLEILQQIKRRQPDVKVMILTSFKTEDYVRESLRAGADGYVLKDASLDELLMAIRSVAKGKNYLSPDVSAHVVQSFLYPAGNGAKSSRLDALTRRERSILQLIAEGRTNRTAAEFLSLSPKTVEKHRATLMQKLGLRNAAELTLMAVELGLIERPFAISRLMNNPSGESQIA